MRRHSASPRQGASGLGANGPFGVKRLFDEVYSGC
jgi:hypothetical protein